MYLLSALGVTVSFHRLLTHRAFQTRPWLRWYELDPSGWLILGLAKVGLAWDVVRVTPEKATAKLAGS